MRSADLVDEVRDRTAGADRGRGPRHAKARSARTTGVIRSSASVAAAGAGLVLWVVAVRQADFSAMSDAGLSSVLGWPYGAAVAVVLAAFVAELAGRQRPAVLTGVIAALVVVLFGTASAVEPVARLPDSWITAGFVQYIASHGHVLRHNDARFYWPGMFSMTALVDRAMGQSSATDLIGWAPLGFELLYLPALVWIRRTIGIGSRAGWLGVAIFYLGNWVEQDYFSPQAVSYLFLLVVVALALQGWRPADKGHPPAGSRRRRARLPRCREMLGTPVYGPASTTALALVLILVSGASVVSHQLTPVAIVFALVALALSRRLPNFELPLLLLMAIMGWVAFAATDFWQYGNAGPILGGIGHVGSSLSSGVAQRVTGTRVHRLITDLRILIGAGVVAAAAVGSLVRRTRTREVELLAIAPFAILALQSYGGEASLRVYLYALPFTALLAGEAGAWLAGWTRWEARRQRPRRAIERAPRAPRTRIVALGIVLVVAAGLLTFVRGGNDPYVAATPADRLAVTTVYRAATPGAIIGDIEPYVPWMDQGMGTWHFVLLVPIVEGGKLRRIEMHTALPPWIILTTTEERYGEIVNGWPVGWQHQAQRWLERQDGYRVYWSRQGAVVLRAPSPRA